LNIDDRRRIIREARAHSGRQYLDDCDEERTYLEVLDLFYSNRKKYPKILMGL